MLNLFRCSRPKSLEHFGRAVRQHLSAVRADFVAFDDRAVAATSPLCPVVRLFPGGDDPPRDIFEPTESAKLSHPFFCALTAHQVAYTCSSIPVWRSRRQQRRDEVEPAETLRRELLTYYVGLAKAVGQGAIKTEGFTVDVVAAKPAETKTERDYVATLKWIEPFATKKPQTLRIETRVWAGAKNRTWAFMCDIRRCGIRSAAST